MKARHAAAIAGGLTFTVGAAAVVLGGGLGLFLAVIGAAAVTAACVMTLIAED